MSILDRLPRRNPRLKPAPKHAAPSVVRFPGPGGPTGDTHITVTAPEPAPLPARVPHLDVPLEFPPALTDEEDHARETLRERLAEVTPEPLAGPSDAEVLCRVLDGLRAIPSRPGAYLRCITPGSAANPHEPLGGFPVFAGVSPLGDGTPCAGLWLGDEDGQGRLVLDVTDRTWLLMLITAADNTLNALDAANAGPDEADGEEEGGEAA